MSRRNDLVEVIQNLSSEEASRQPTAADWLQDQDDKARVRRERDPNRKPDHDYEDDDRGEVGS